jgi:hypothetical protein
MSTVEEQTYVNAADATKYAQSTVIGYLDGNGKFVAIGPTSPLPSGRASVTVATLSTVASLATNQAILGVNLSRTGAIIYNSDANALLIKYGATASASSFTYRIAAGAHWEMPLPVYQGPIDGIWEADGSGSAFITEL